MKQIELGTLTKPQGLKGEFRIKHNIDSFQLFKDLKNITIGKNQYTVLSTTDRGGFFVVKTKELTVCALFAALSLGTHLRHRVSKKEHPIFTIECPSFSFNHSLRG